MSGSSVYIGTCEGENVFDEKSGWEVDRVGGMPVWLSGECQRTCNKCKEDVLFVGQLYCPMDEQHHRVLYLFSCTQPPCILNGCNWIVLSCQKNIEKELKTETKVEVKSVFDDFSFDNLDWNMGGEDNISIECAQASNKKVHELAVKTNEVVDRMDNLSVGVQEVKEDSQSSTRNLMKERTFFKAGSDFKPFYIDVFLEEDQHDDLSHEYQVLQEYLKKEKINISDIEKSTKADYKSCAGVCMEPYEKPSREISSWQKKFFKRVKRCPRQILRYAYKDQPLFYNASINPSDIQACCCGAERVFELQLMPALLECLVPTNPSNMLLHSLESSCVFVFTCSKNCQRDVKEEGVVVQRDIETRMLS